MKRIASSLAIVACATTTMLAGDAMTTTYTGCVEAVNHGATLMLTHVGQGPMAAKPDDMSMKPEDMSMKHEDMAMGRDSMQAPPTALALSGRSDLRKHVGQKIEVIGMISKGAANSMRDDLQTLSVSSLKVIAKKCTQEGM